MRVLCVVVFAVDMPTEMWPISHRTTVPLEVDIMLKCISIMHRAICFLLPTCPTTALAILWMHLNWWIDQRNEGSVLFAQSVKLDHTRT